MQQGKCRLVDVELQIHSHVEDVICIFRRESVYWWMRIHGGLKKVCITHCERVLESVERAAGGLLVDVAQQVQGEQSVRRQLARRSLLAGTKQSSKVSDLDGKNDFLKYYKHSFEGLYI